MTTANKPSSHAFTARIVFTTAFGTDGTHIAAVYRVLNPDKLEHVRTHLKAALQPPSTIIE